MDRPTSERLTFLGEDQDPALPQTFNPNNKNSVTRDDAWIKTTGA
ncbi:MAG: hypothetical protein P8Q54_13425 [Akkermansiaceae bacterium]|nr:hypothetical protein [Akkermansiaceae bacterium]MDG1364466.1 hypothetical protein [Akkermansiaceae bacterium]